MTINTKAARDILVKELKLDGFTEQEQREIVDLLHENIVIKVNNDIFELLDDADRTTFISLSETANNEEIGIFLKDKIANLDGLIKRAAEYIIRDFKKFSL